MRECDKMAQSSSSRGAGKGATTPAKLMLQREFHHMKRNPPSADYYIHDLNHDNLFGEFITLLFGRPCLDLRLGSGKQVRTAIIRPGIATKFSTCHACFFSRNGCPFLFAVWMIRAVDQVWLSTRAWNTESFILMTRKPD
jgi:hypothetical protein